MTFVRWISAGSAVCLAAVCAVFANSELSTGSRLVSASRHAESLTKGLRGADLQERAGAALDRGDLAEAESLYRRLISERPDDRLLYKDLADVYDRQGKFTEARDAYGHLFERAAAGGFVSIQAPQEAARYGDLCLQFGETTNAERAYRLAIGVADPMWWHSNGADLPIDVPAKPSLRELEGLAYAAAITGFGCDGPGYLTQASAAVRLSPRSVYVHSVYADALSRNGHIRASFAEFQRARRIASSEQRACIDKAIGAFYSFGFWNHGAVATVRKDGSVSFRRVERTLPESLPVQVDRFARPSRPRQPPNSPTP